MRARYRVFQTAGSRTGHHATGRIRRSDRVHRRFRAHARRDPSVEFRSGSTPNSEPGIPYSAEAESVLLMALVPAASSTRRGRIQKPRMYV